MAQAGRIRVNDEFRFAVGQTFTHSFFTQTAGFDFRLNDPGISFLVMAQFVHEEDEENVESYSMMVGISF
jgi:hypothetical protein